MRHHMNDSIVSIRRYPTMAYLTGPRTEHYKTGGRYNNLASNYSGKSCPDLIWKYAYKPLSTIICCGYLHDQLRISCFNDSATLPTYQLCYPNVKNGLAFSCDLRRKMTMTIDCNLLVMRNPFRMTKNAAVKL